MKKCNLKIKQIRKISQLNGNINKLYDFMQTSDVFGAANKILITNTSEDSNNYLSFIVSWSNDIFLAYVTGWSLTDSWTEFAIKNLIDGTIDDEIKFYAMKESGRIRIKFQWTKDYGNAQWSVLSLQKNIQLSPFTVS